MAASLAKADISQIKKFTLKDLDFCFIQNVLENPLIYQSAVHLKFSPVSNRRPAKLGVPCDVRQKRALCAAGQAHFDSIC